MKPATDLVVEACDRLSLDVPVSSVNFSRRFKKYNANVRRSLSSLEFNLSKEWKRVDDEIVIGLIQSLLVKVYKIKKQTLNIDLYENFVKKIHLVVPKTLNDPFLESSYNRVNDEYFFGMITRPNLKWGGFSRSTLGTYDYKSDLITISSVFKESPLELLDYVMYHELLHKKHKFYSKNGRSFHHTSKFRKDEKAFGDYEKKLKLFLRGKKKVIKVKPRSFLSRIFG